MGQNEILMEIKVYLEQNSNEILHIKICVVQLKQFLKIYFFKMFKEKKA